MTDDLEPSQHDPPATASTDPWSIWFSRLVQVAGLGIMAYETLSSHGERPWLMLFASGMMLGGIGLQLILRWVAARVPG